MTASKRVEQADGRPSPFPRERELRERELIARWRAGEWVGASLRAKDGARFTVIFQGRPGGSCGPDFRDAVLLDGAGARITGDVELHLRPQGWRAHGHATDPRYNAVALHVTLTATPGDAQQRTPLADGRSVPLVALCQQEPFAAAAPMVWPCASFGARETHEASAWRLGILRAAGWTRFNERVATFRVELQRSHMEVVPGWDSGDSALLAALAEALGYGRDRAALRACGDRLAHGEPADGLLTTALRLPATERRRLEGLFALVERWQAQGPTAALIEALLRGAERAGSPGAMRALIEALRVAGGSVSPGRARILAINVALPYLAAWASVQPLSKQTAALADLMALATEALPGLPSNQITREMARQLGLRRLPAGALAQQGLHHVWRAHCREKLCAGCPCALATFAPVCYTERCAT